MTLTITSTTNINIQAAIENAKVKTINSPSVGNLRLCSFNFLLTNVAPKRVKAIKIIFVIKLLEPPLLLFSDSILYLVTPILIFL